MSTKKRDLIKYANSLEQKLKRESPAEVIELQKRVISDLLALADSWDETNNTIFLDYADWLEHDLKLDRTALERSIESVKCAVDTGAYCVNEVVSVQVKRALIERQQVVINDLRTLAGDAPLRREG